MPFFWTSTRFPHNSMDYNIIWTQYFPFNISKIKSFFTESISTLNTTNVLSNRTIKSESKIWTTTVFFPSILNLCHYVADLKFLSHLIIYLSCEKDK